MFSLSQKLKTAIYFGDVSEVKKLLKSTRKPLSSNPFICGGHNLLNLSIRLRKKEISKLLIKKGARLNKKRDNKLFSPLHQAVRQRCTEVVELLVKKGADVNVTSNYNITPLSLLILLAHQEKFFPSTRIAKCLLSNGADIEVEIQRPHWIGTALNFACNDGCFKYTKLLLKYNADVNQNKFYDQNPIVLPIIRDHGKIIKLLLEYGAHANSYVDINFVFNVQRNLAFRLNSLGTPTILHIAIIGNQVSTVDLLLKHGADVHSRTVIFERTPLMIAIEEYVPDIVNLLLKYGARVDVFDSLGISPLHYLVCNPSNRKIRFDPLILEGLNPQKAQILNALINAGANVNEALAPVGTKLTFFRTAVKYGQVEIVRNLIIGNYLDFSLLDSEIIQASKLDLSLLPQDLIDNQDFMKYIKGIYETVEIWVMTGIIRSNLLGGPVRKELVELVMTKPVNDFWSHNDYVTSVRDLQKGLMEVLEGMRKTKIGDSYISLWHLLTSPWDRLVNHAFNKDVRELCLDNYFEKFPPYYFIMKNRTNAAIKRSKLVEKSSDIAFVIFKLPLDCYSRILDYLKDSDLDMLSKEFSYLA